MLERFWIWVRGEREPEVWVRSEALSNLEPLEPRLLLNADFGTSASLASLHAPVGTSAVVVDLEEEDPLGQEGATPLLSFGLESSRGSEGDIDSASGSAAVPPATEAELTSAESLAVTEPSQVESGSQVESDPGISTTLTEKSPSLLVATDQEDGPSNLDTLTTEARGPPTEGELRLTIASSNSYAGPSDPSDGAVNPVTHTQKFAGVDVQPSTAVATLLFAPLGFPVSFDLRTSGDVTSVKDQGQLGSCWAFATYGSLESTILVDGGALTDLSENHLKNYHGFDWTPAEGGNYFMSQAYLSRWDGPVSESDDPYHDRDDRPSPGGPPQYYVREMLEFDTDSELKTGLMTYGAIGTVMYVDNNYYNATTHTYYYGGTASANHAVTMVGWDDSKTVPGAPGAGAWLIQNSWGAEWGEGGYFWLSYSDSRGANDGFSFYDAVPPSTYQKVYYKTPTTKVGFTRPA